MAHGPWAAQGWTAKIMENYDPDDFCLKREEMQLFIVPKMSQRKGGTNAYTVEIPENPTTFLEILGWLAGCWLLAGTTKTGYGTTSVGCRGIVSNDWVFS